MLTSKVEFLMVLSNFLLTLALFAGKTLFSSEIWNCQFFCRSLCVTDTSAYMIRVFICRNLTYTSLNFIQLPRFEYPFVSDVERHE
jgi:hypothetical protein